MPTTINISKADLAALSSVTGDVLTSEDGNPVYQAKATADQASFTGLDLVCIGDSQVRGSSLDDLTTQPWPALVGQALPGATVTNLGIHGANSAACLADAQNRIDDPENRSFVVMWGRNDINQGLSLDVPKANTQAAVIWFGSDRYLFVTVPYEDDAAHGVSSTTAAVDEFNAWLQSTYPGKVLDLNAIYAANADPANAGDTADVAASITPRSLRNDYVHANAAGHAIQAEAVLSMLGVIAPESKPVLEPKSQANALGATSARAAVNRANVWQRKQTFPGGFLVPSVGASLGDNTGFAVGGLVGEVQNRWLAIAKFLGSSGSFVKAAGVTADFFITDSTSDVFAGTRTSNLKWLDNLFQFLSVIHCNGDGFGTVYGSSGGKAYAIQKVAGMSGAHTRQSGGSIRFRTSNNADATLGTFTDEIVWNNSGWQSNVDVFVQGENHVVAVGASSSPLGLYKKPGAGPGVAMGLGTDFVIREASTASLVGNISSATFTERFKVAATTGAVSFAGSLSAGGGAAVTKILPASATLDFPEIAAGASTSLTISVTGATAGSSVALGPPSGGIEAGLRIEAPRVSADTVTVTLTNTTGSPINPASALYKCVVFNS